ncbi:unnamed protein product [Gordionus sp. m RMFG-2023]
MNENHILYRLLKPCDYYKDEYKYCKSFKVRFQQIYINGKFDDCKIWKKDYENCKNWINNKDKMLNVLESDKERLIIRSKGILNNDVWERREITPPDSWVKPLPKYFAHKSNSSHIQPQNEDDSKI